MQRSETVQQYLAVVDSGDVEHCLALIIDLCLVLDL